MSTVFTQARFLTSAFELDQLVQDDGSEIAFAGRSNAGKSTAINRLTRHRNLCKTSKTPGRTQLINFFELDESHRLVDLPGYGYAKVPIKMREHWNRVLTHYLLERESLKGLIILVDIRRGLTDLDSGLIELVKHHMPMHILLTKSDKLKKGAMQRARLQTLKQVAALGASVSCFSALSGYGLEEFESVCDDLLYQDQQMISSEISD
jgi:GTP-binding protein